jgi:adenylate cyclase class 2
MTYEVEQKFPVAELKSLETRLVSLGASVSGPREEVDLYFAHPARDFSTTDEALRIRRVGDSVIMTYKGPKIDSTTKTRREIELPLGCAPETAQATAADWRRLLETLGFRPVAEVRKLRRRATVPWQGRPVLVTLDDVDELGTFVELEMVVEEEELEAAKDRIASLAARLDLNQSQRLSYLELLLEGRERS